MNQSMVRARTLLLFLALCIVASSLLAAIIGVKDAAFVTNRPAVAGGGNWVCATNPLSVSILTNLNNGTDAVLFETPVFTPASNSLILAFIEITGKSAGTFTLSCSNKGIQQLTWWTAATVDGRVMETWVTQLPQGMTPFPMQFVYWVSGGTCFGADCQVVQVTGANPS